DSIAALGGARSSPIYLICLVAARRPPGSRAARDGFFTTSEARLAAYRGLFEGALSRELLQRPRDCTNGGFGLGSLKFERQIAALLGRRTGKGSPGRPRKETDAGGQGELAL
ncbi:MAG: hypothetical protein ACFCVA_09700, partial [Gammaproteobacteria bacterium]